MLTTWRCGSLKRASFVVLEADPMTVPGDALRQIKVTATVFAGEPYPTP